jgi:PelA/Pel-15E family pectate lyase
MRDSVAYNGGYVWAYAADLSKRWGEMEAYPSMIWIQPPGTATVGHLYLDAYHATGDEYFYDAAVEVGLSLVGAQHPSGGWNYLYDFAGEESTQRWYDTIGKNGWRLEEFHHYYGNATFDDAGTAEASQLMLRLALEKGDKRFEAALEKAIGFVVDSQYENGGWPQRYPFVDDAPELHGRPDYTRYVTFNDDVAGENIKFLLMVWQTLGDQRALDTINKAMQIFPATQQAAPQAGWGLQHTVEELAPVGARSYEPDALVTHTTAGNISLMLDFYEWTGDDVFLERIPEAFDWLESVRLSADEIRMPGREFPTFIEIGSNRALINHRRGSNVVNGEYYQDYNPENPIAHYSQWRAIDLDGLRARYETLRAASKDELLANSPFNKRPDFELPRYFTTKRIEVSDLNASRAPAGEQPTPAQVTAIIDGLNDEGYWPTPLRAVANPYIGDGSAEPAAGDFGQTRVGDASDTSPYISDNPVEGISISSFIDAMSMLIRALDSSDEPVVWRLDNLEVIGGLPVTVAGEPTLIDTPAGKALEFDGVDDAIFLDAHPLQGMSTFTVEVIFNPYKDGAAEQRFFHMQESASDARVMFETRLVDGNRWFLDTFVKSGEQRVTLFAEDHTHAIGQWRHAAIVVDGAMMRHYVDGQLELSGPLQYRSQGSGGTSLGARINRVHWFKGAIRTARFTPRVLEPDEFLTASS